MAIGFSNMDAIVDLKKSKDVFLCFGVKAR